jgi:large subunit ribosomal protein L31
MVMKKDIHPKYQKVLFIDSTTGHKYLCGTTLVTEEKEMFEGKEYPVCRVSISSLSHPLFVGGKQYVDTEGRVERFNKRYQAAQQQAAQQKNQEQESKDEKKESKKPAAAKKKKV